VRRVSAIGLVTAELFANGTVVASTGDEFVAVQAQSGRSIRPPIPVPAEVSRSGNVWSRIGRAHIIADLNLKRAMVINKWSPDGSTRNSFAASVDLWDWEKGHKIRTLFERPGVLVKSAAVNARSDRLVTLSQSGNEGAALELWDATTGALVNELKATQDSNRNASRFEGAFFNPDGLTVYAIGWPGGLTAWDAVTGRHLWSKYCQGNYVTTSPDGTLLVTVSEALNIDSSTVWSLTPDGPKQLWQMVGKVSHAVFGPGNRLVTATMIGKTSTVRVWDATAGRPVTPDVPFPTRVEQLALNSAGDRILVVSARETGQVIQVLDAATGQPLTPRFHAPRSRLLAARFGDDGESVVAVLATGEMVKWELSELSGDVESVAELATVRTGRQLDPAGTLAFLRFEEMAQSLPTLREKFPAQFRGEPEAVAGWRAAHMPQDVLARIEIAELNGQIDTEARNPALFAKRAAAHMTLRNYSAAEADWSRAAELAPDQPSHRLERGFVRAYYLAKLLWDDKKPQEAERIWDEGMKDLLETVDGKTLLRFHSQLINELLWPIARRPDAGAERHRLAAVLADRIRARWMTYAELNTLGVIYYRVGRYSDAIDALTASDNLQPGEPANLAFLAMAHHKLGHAADASKWWDLAYKAASDPKYANNENAAAFLKEAKQVTGF
jgi:WD40 repeat protein/tetratricopeptide (TPR) repeat protein